MSHSTESRPSGQGNRRSGNQNRNRNNNRNRNRNRRGGNRNNRNQGGRNNRGGQSRNNRSRGPRRPEPKPLTLWEKFLKLIGLGPKEAPKRRPQKKFDDPGKPRKSNTRDAKGRSPRKPRETPNPDAVTGTRLYVGNLSFDANESDLEDLFRGVGNVKLVDIVYNRQTHRSKGYAFVEMSQVEESKRAVEVLHDQPFMGRQLIVNGAKSKGAADGGADDGDGEGGERPRRESRPPADDLPDRDSEEVVSLGD